MNFDISTCRIAVIGAGRLGTALVRALREAGVGVHGPLLRGEEPPAGSDVLILCVGDADIAALAQSLRQGPVIGHCAGSLGLDCLAPHTRTFSMHPLMTVGEASTLAGAPAAIDGHDDEALTIAAALARVLEMRPFHVDERDRAAYHAAATFASNFLITVEDAAERLAASAGVERKMLVGLVQASVDNWAAMGARKAITGPVARGDVPTVARQREAVVERTPDLLALFDQLCNATAAIARPLEVPA